MNLWYGGLKLTLRSGFFVCLFGSEWMGFFYFCLDQVHSLIVSSRAVALFADYVMRIGFHGRCPLVVLLIRGCARATWLRSKTQRVGTGWSGKVPRRVALTWRVSKKLPAGVPQGQWWCQQTQGGHAGVFAGMGRWWGFLGVACAGGRFRGYIKFAEGSASYGLLMHKKMKLHLGIF